MASARGDRGAGGGGRAGLAGAADGSKEGTEGKEKDDEAAEGSDVSRDCSTRCSRSSTLGNADMKRVGDGKSLKPLKAPRSSGAIPTPPAGPLSSTPRSASAMGTPPSWRNCMAESSQTVAGSCTSDIGKMGGALPVRSTASSATRSQVSARGLEVGDNGTADCRKVRDEDCRGDVEGRTGGGG